VVVINEAEIELEVLEIEGGVAFQAEEEVVVEPALIFLSSTKVQAKWISGFLKTKIFQS